MKLTKWSPAKNELANLSKRMNSLVDNFFGDEAETTVYDFEPAIDIQEKDDRFEIAAELPGLEKDDIDISLKNDVLLLSGEKEQKKEEKEGDSYRSERVFGKFQRSFRLPEMVEEDEIEAEFDNGILTINLPKSEESTAEQKEIEIK